MAGCSGVGGSTLGNGNLPQQFSPPPTATLAVVPMQIVFSDAGNLGSDLGDDSGRGGNNQGGGNQGGEGGGYIEPVAGRVVDWFRRPAHIGAPGNRGWEYETQTDSPVVAAEAGHVRFAGQVGGSLYVSINHPDGVRTTYSHVKDIAVKKGDFVEQGSVLASTKGASFHFGAIKDGDYIDPAELMREGLMGSGGGEGDGPKSVRLVPREGIVPGIGSSGVKSSPQARQRVIVEGIVSGIGSSGISEFR